MPLPHEELLVAMIIRTLELIGGVDGLSKSYTQLADDIGVPKESLGQWLMGVGRPGTTLHHKMIAFLVDIDIEEAVQDGDAFAQSQFILNTIAKLGKCDVSHISRMLGSKTGNRRKWLSPEHRARIHELALWAILKYDFERIAVVDWQNRRVFLYEDTSNPIRARIRVNGMPWYRPRNPIDFMGRHIRPTKLEIDYIPGLGSIRKGKTVDDLLGAGNVGQVVMDVGTVDSEVEETIEQMLDIVEREVEVEVEAESPIEDTVDHDDGLAPIVDEDDTEDDPEQEAPVAEEEEEVVLAKDREDLPPGYVGETVVSEDHKETAVTPSGVFEGKAGVSEDASSAADILEGKAPVGQKNGAIAEEELLEEEWDTDNDGPNPDMPFQPRPGRNKQGEKLLWSMNRRRTRR